MILLNSRKMRESRRERLAGLEPVVLMGRGKSGTRLMARMGTTLGLNLGVSEALATGDADDQTFTDAIKALALDNLDAVSSADIDGKDLERFRAAVDRLHERLGRPRTLWGWKFPETYFLGPYIQAAFPRARYLHLVRDGRDLAFKNHLTDDPGRKLGHRLLARLDALDAPHHVQAARSWAHQVENFATFAAGLPPGRVWEATFERLCREPRAVAEEMAAFLDLPMNAECEAYLGELSDKHVGEFRRQPPERVAEAEKAAAAGLERHGYL